jgi:hypothetical protein
VKNLINLVFLSIGQSNALHKKLEQVTSLKTQFKENTTNIKDIKSKNIS